MKRALWGAATWLFLGGVGSGFLDPAFGSLFLFGLLYQEHDTESWRGSIVLWGSFYVALFVTLLNLA